MEKQTLIVAAAHDILGTLEPQIHFPYSAIERWRAMSAATSVAHAVRHHARHGDMDGNVCLLNRCALHYPARLTPRQRRSSRLMRRRQ